MDLILKAIKDFTDILIGKEIIFFLFGSEGFGMREAYWKDIQTFSVKIEINKDVESLNISNSAAIVFHHINEKKKKT